MFPVHRHLRSHPFALLDSSFPILIIFNFSLSSYIVDDLVDSSTDIFSNINSLSEAKFLLNILFSQATEKNVPRPPVEIEMNSNSLLALVKESYLSDENKTKDRISQFNDGGARGTTSGRKGGAMSTNVFHDKLNKNSTNANSSNNMMGASNKNKNINSSVNIAGKIAAIQKSGNITTSSLNNTKTKGGHVLISGKGTGAATKSNSGSGSGSNQAGLKVQRLPLAKSALSNNVNVMNRSTKSLINISGIRPNNSSSHMERKNTAANVAASLLSMTASIKNCLPSQGGVKSGSVGPLQKIRKLNESLVDRDHGIKRIKTVRNQFLLVHYLTVARFARFDDKVYELLRCDRTLINSNIVLSNSHLLGRYCCTSSPC